MLKLTEINIRNLLILQEKGIFWMFKSNIMQNVSLIENNTFERCNYLETTELSGNLTIIPKNFVSEYSG